MKSKFELGDIVTTNSIAKLIKDDGGFCKEVIEALARYRRADFLDMEYVEDVQKNYSAIYSGKARIFATYNTSQGKIYIITEWDRSVTTILFPYEY